MFLIILKVNDIYNKNHNLIPSQFTFIEKFFPFFFLKEVEYLKVIKCEFVIEITVNE